MRCLAVILSLAFATVAGAAGAGNAEPVGQTRTASRERATAARIRDVEEAFSRSSDLAVRALFTLPPMTQRADGTIRSEEDRGITDLVALARGSTDPVVLDVLSWRCALGPTACDRLDLATRWTQADTQNQVAWLTLAALRDASGDVDGAREAFLRAARASLWHEHGNDVIRRSVAALPADLSTFERGAAVLTVLVTSGAFQPMQPLAVLGRYCKEPGAMRDACGRIVETMVRDTNSLMALTVAVPFATRANVAPSTIVSYQLKADAVRWATVADASISSMDFDPDDAANARTLRTFVERLQTRADLGEVGTARRYLAERHVGDAEAADRYVASLSRDQIARRADLRARWTTGATADAASAGSARSTTASP